MGVRSEVMRNFMFKVSIVKFQNWSKNLNCSKRDRGGDGGRRNKGRRNFDDSPKTKSDLDAELDTVSFGLKPPPILPCEFVLWVMK